jgi:TonB family protein
VPPTYPESAIKEHVQGVVLLDSTITRAGCVSAARVVSGVDPRLDMASLRTVLQWRFTPSQVQGAAVPVRMSVVVAFTLQ